jgi:hypothetical protein
LGEKKSMRPELFPSEIVKFGGVPITTYILIFQNATIPSDWIIATVVDIYKGRDRLTVSNYRHTSLTTVFCKQLGHFWQVFEVSLGYE